MELNEENNGEELEGEQMANKADEEVAKSIPILFLAKQLNFAQKQRIRCSLRLLHYPDEARTKKLFRQYKKIEEYLNQELRDIIETHPAWTSFGQHIKGVGLLNLGKIVPHIRIKPDPNNPVAKWAKTISGLWAFAGQAPGRDKAIKGEKSPFNKVLKSMCWRLSVGLLKAQIRKEPENSKIKKAIGKLGQFFLDEKQRLRERFIAEGMTILPQEEIEEKLKDVLKGLPKKEKPAKIKEMGYISEGNVHNKANRLMIKMFLAMMMVAWCKAEGIPLPDPYVQWKLGHTKIYKPEEFFDK